jgi:peptidoglycan/xylan/chitin deacetylase (PgdA/CDA1 family)
VTSRTAALARVLTTTRLDRLARLSWRGLLVLNYHRIGRPGPADDPDLYSCTPEEFDHHVRLLADRFEVVAAGSEDWQTGGPARRVAITVDDGYRDQMQAAEILAGHGLAGTFFITTGFVDEPSHAWWDEIAWLTGGERADLPESRWLPGGLAASTEPTRYRRRVNTAFKALAGDDGERFLDDLAGWTGRPRLTGELAADQWMDWAMVRELDRLGMEVGAHSVTHPVLATLGADRQHEEIAGSVRRLRAELDGTVDLFSYPVGARTSFDETTRAQLTELGVRRAFSFYGGVNAPDHSDPMDIARAGVFRDHTPEVVAAMAAVPGVLCAPSRHA